MSHFQRLEKALKKLNVTVNFERGIYRLSRPDSEATVLLPESLPLEAKAVKQLLDFAAVRQPGHEGHVCKACATPDFHPGSIAPVGSVVATTPDLVIPAAIGTDINCGIRLIATGMDQAHLAPHADACIAALRRCLLENGRNVPVPSKAFHALFEHGPEAWLAALQREGVWAGADFDRLYLEMAEAIGLDRFESAARHAPPALMPEREVVRDPQLGTVGSGNHFVELQVVDAVLDRHLAYRHGLRAGMVMVMIHSGSRDVGFYVGQRWMDRARAEWPKAVSHPESGLYGLTGPLATEYLQAMGAAARYAWANRVVLAELVREALATTAGCDGGRLIVDVPHNVVMREHGLNIHRKGATPAHAGELALIPGSMGDASYLVEGLGNADWLWSCSHGAGRRLRRQAVRASKLTDDAPYPWHCVTLREERRIEEAPSAYKPVGPVIEAQSEAGLIHPVVRLRPWVTFKA
ncbi:RtcB family protein [Parachitinimonas caeni]|uniref:tRNA-splicing ligase RtcB n=1 Tax=Parachitinimonas caeni TaxID=3031301 RepID=A0ABT7DX02_9NEIS|nr:RtcB family protein [Parachitinimonas caeni]MDK2124592.1 RtcB family protein [Parachitinimonas caeni]